MVLLYIGCDQNNRNKYYEVLRDFQIIEIGDLQKEKTMDEILASLEGLEEEAFGSDEPFLYFVDEDVKKVSRILSDLKDAGIPVARTAVQTPTNATWKFEDLYKEVGREAAYFQKREQLADALQKADPKRFREDEKYAKIIMTFYEMLKAEELDEEMLDMALAVAENLDKRK